LLPRLPPEFPLEVEVREALLRDELEELLLVEEYFGADLLTTDRVRPVDWFVETGLLVELGRL